MSLLVPAFLPELFDAQAKYTPEAEVLAGLVAGLSLSADDRARISTRAAGLVRRVRAEARPSLMEQFLAEYGLSTREGVALMCLAEAMLRVPDAETMDALIEDKIAPSDWGVHLGAAASPLVNASTWALMLTGRVLDDEKPGLAGVLRGAIRRLGEPVIRTAVGRAMKEMGRQFVLGETIEAALARARTLEAQGYGYSYDMLGEAARTAADAARHARAYGGAIAALARARRSHDVRDNPGISVKLSALHPRYEVAQADRVSAELVPVLRDLALAARAAGIGLNIDAEEQDRLSLSLAVIEAVLEDPALAGWDGFGVVVQAYGKRAGAVIDGLYTLACRLDRRLMVRLVKGAYWDSEMRQAQIGGFSGFSLFTTKAATDVSYLANAKKLFGYSARLYPQFATHNAHSVAAILEMAQGRPFEFQRLHGMGERLYEIVRAETGARCRIYAPVGAHRDLLAYLVRRLLENGANSSFVHQIVDEAVPAEVIAADPLAALESARPPAGLVAPAEIFGAGRRNARGFDLTEPATLAEIARAGTAPLAGVGPLVACALPASQAAAPRRPVTNPATGETLAPVTEASPETVAAAISAARPWAASVTVRAATLRRAADLFEAEFGAILACLQREAGKTLADAVGELREAVDFLRYYAREAEVGATAGLRPRGVFAAISPWNFPLAIFTGQIAAALASGNAVLAKPAEPTPLVAGLAVRLMHQAGVPARALQLLPGAGGVVGAALTRDPRIDGVVFTGSTATARRIQAAMADHLAPGAPLIAETGGINAMIVDSTALAEQAVRDILASAFQSAGQRCSALRCLYVQADVAPALIEMLKGAMDELRLGDPEHLATDLGPVITEAARADIEGHVARAEAEGRLLHRLRAPEGGRFVAPSLIAVRGIEEIAREVFGPVLHVATFEAADLDRVIDAVNASGYGLTFGLHTRIDARVQHLADRLHVGNLYVNRNQIGAVVGSQPFGGEGLSGTGPKAGGPFYLRRFCVPAGGETAGETGGETGGGAGGGARAEPPAPDVAIEAPCDFERLRAEIAGAAARPRAPIARFDLPGPTGESNSLSLVARGPVLCLGPGPAARAAQLAAVEALGGLAVAVEGRLDPQALEGLEGIAAVLYRGEAARPLAQALARRPGPIVPLVTTRPDQAHVAHERHLCIDTTAAGGNAALLAG